MSGDDLLLLTDRIRVTRQKVVVGLDTYSISNVSTVRAKSLPPDRRQAAALIGIGALLLAFALVGLTRERVEATSILAVFIIGGPPALAIGTVSLAAGLWLALKARPRFMAVLTTLAGETRTITSPNRSEIDAIVAAVERARSGAA